MKNLFLVFFILGSTLIHASEVEQIEITTNANDNSHEMLIDAVIPKKGNHTQSSYGRNQIKSDILKAIEKDFNINELMDHHCRKIQSHESKAIKIKATLTYVEIIDFLKATYSEVKFRFYCK